ncbi:uncharacterized protein TNCV_2776611 [Trichonephila clavipes]|nr:uncharacterized protein TNCV_2776611 [Trichonephila clavipes]
MSKYIPRFSEDQRRFLTDHHFGDLCNRGLCAPLSLRLALIPLSGCGSPVVKVSDHGRHVMSSSPVPLKTLRVGERCKLNLSRAQTSFRWCGVVVRRGGASLGVVRVT